MFTTSEKLISFSRYTDKTVFFIGGFMTVKAVKKMKYPVNFVYISSGVQQFS